MHVRRGGIEDLEAVAALFDAYRQFYQQPADIEKSRSFLGGRLANGDSVIFLAEEDGVVIGFTQLYPLFSSTVCRPIWLLNDLFTIAEARGKGVGRALMEAARQHAVHTGAASIELSTAHTNLPAQRLYESLGYVKDETYRVYTLRL